MKLSVWPNYVCLIFVKNLFFSKKAEKSNCYLIVLFQPNTQVTLEFVLELLDFNKIFNFVKCIVRGKTDKWNLFLTLLWCALVLYYEEVTVFTAKYKITTSLHFVVNIFSHM